MLFSLNITLSIINRINYTVIIFFDINSTKNSYLFYNKLKLISCNKSQKFILFNLVSTTSPYPTTTALTSTYTSVITQQSTTTQNGIVKQFLYIKIIKLYFKILFKNFVTKIFFGAHRPFFLYILEIIALDYLML